MHGNIDLEICCGDLLSVFEAKKGGAKRIELCSGLSEGGLTPSISMIERAVGSGIPQVNILIRPRRGDFYYSSEEISLIKSDITHAVRAGAGGVVIGALTPSGDVDTEVMKRLIEAAKSEREDTHITFHRAFDLSNDYSKALEEIIKLGCDTLLTSGMAPNAFGGIETLKKLVSQAEGRISIMAGGGINTSNILEIIRQTGVKTVHTTARKFLQSRMIFRRPNVSMGSSGEEEYGFLTTNADIVSKLIQIIEQ